MSYISRGVTSSYGSHMDRALIISYLQAAEEHVANGVQDIADQRDLISTLETDRPQRDQRDCPAA